MSDTPPTRLVPLGYPGINVGTECDGHMPFLVLGDANETVVGCIRPPRQHIGMDADCDCCDCTAHMGPRWSSLRWNRYTPGAMRGARTGPGHPANKHLHPDTTDVR